MIKKFEISNNSLVPSEPDGSPGLVLVNPDTEEKNLLLGKYSLDEHTPLSALDPDEVSRIEIDDYAVSII